LLQQEELPTRGAGAFGSLDDPISIEQQRLGHRQPERLRGSTVDDQLELGRLLDGEVAGLGSLENLVDVDGGTVEQVRVKQATTKQPTSVTPCFSEELLVTRRRRARILKARSLLQHRGAAPTQSWPGPRTGRHLAARV